MVQNSPAVVPYRVVFGIFVQQLGDMVENFDGVLLLYDLAVLVSVLTTFTVAALTFVFTKSTSSLYRSICCSSFCRASSERTTEPEPREIPC